MTSAAPPRAAPVANDRVAWARDAGISAFAATTGALIIFCRTRGGAFTAFATVGRRVAREIAFPYWGDAMLGVAIHLGEMFVLGALAALLAGAMQTHSRLRSALLAACAWELGSLFGPFAVVRVDVAAGLPLVLRAGLAVLLVTALALAPKKAPG